MIAMGMDSARRDAIFGRLSRPRGVASTRIAIEHWTDAEVGVKAPRKLPDRRAIRTPGPSSTPVWRHTPTVPPVPDVEREFSPNMVALFARLREDVSTRDSLRDIDTVEA